jgi:hypothetical protein
LIVAEPFVNIVHYGAPIINELSQCHDCTNDYLENLLHLDAMAVSAQILTILENHGRRESLLALQGSQAQALLDLIQAVCSLTAHDVVPDSSCDFYSSSTSLSSTLAFARRS